MLDVAWLRYLNAVYFIGVKVNGGNWATCLSLDPLKARMS